MITKDNAKEWLVLIQALAKGKTIQRFSDPNNWFDVTEIITNPSISIYRIKPEPRRFWLNVYGKGKNEGISIFSSKEDAEYALNKKLGKTIEVVEVI